jgi:hypothetical protein
MESFVRIKARTNNCAFGYQSLKSEDKVSLTITLKNIVIQRYSSEGRLIKRPCNA